jgi:hypothetical protein
MEEAITFVNFAVKVSGVLGDRRTIYGTDNTGTEWVCIEPQLWESVPKHDELPRQIRQGLTIGQLADIMNLRNVRVV